MDEDLKAKLTDFIEAKTNLNSAKDLTEHFTLCDVLKEKYNALKNTLSTKGKSLGVNFNMGGG